MGKARIEAFSDGVLAIIITIMVLELKVPHEADLSALISLMPVFLSYILSFLNIGIYWNNHHHLFQAVRKVNGQVLWANLHLLFWLSLLPFATAWMGEHFTPITVTVYGLDLLLSGFAYLVLTQVLIAHHGRDSMIAIAMGRDYKGRISLVIYAIAITLATMTRIELACLLYVSVAILWLIPDRRIEKNLLP